MEKAVRGHRAPGRRVQLARSHSEELQHVRTAVETHLIRSVVNELLRLSAADHREWICECGHAGCDVRVVLSVDDYEAVRARPHRFVVAPLPRHALPQVDEVVQREEGYWIVALAPKAQSMARSFRCRTRADPDSSPTIQ